MHRLATATQKASLDLPYRDSQLNEVDLSFYQASVW
jgi:hypothetical protein